MCNWGLSKAYSSLTNQDHLAVFGFMKLLLKYNLTTTYDVNMFLCGIGSGYRLASFEITQENDWAESIAGIINRSIYGDEHDEEETEE